MIRPQRSSKLLRRCALGLWLLGIALIGAMEWYRAAFAGGGFSPSVIAWLWALGALSTGSVGAVMLVREWRQPPPGRG